MNQDKALIKNAAIEDMFLLVAPEHMVQSYFNYFESADPDVQDKKMALATMYASKYAKVAFKDLLAFYKANTHKDYELFSNPLPGMEK